MFDPYGALYHTITYDRKLHKSRDCRCNLVVYMGSHSPHLLLFDLAKTYMAHCHKNIDPGPAMSYYRSTCVSQLTIGQEVDHITRNNYVQ